MGFLKNRFGQDAREMAKVRRHLEAAKSRMPASVVSTHEHSFRHRNEILLSDECGCFYCGRIFAPTEIIEWVDRGQTALCPKCGIDSVIGSAAGIPLTKEFLNEMHNHWF